MLRLHHSPMACSLASRLALAETGLEHEVVFVRTARGEQNSPAYRRINPRGKVPALETSEGVLLESTAILPFISDLAPDKGLFPPVGSFARANGQAWLSFFSSTLHAALRDAMFPARGCDGEEARSAAIERVATAFGQVEAHLKSQDYVLGQFSICDLYLLVFLLWRSAPDLAGKLPAYPRLDALQQQLCARPAILAILGEEIRLRMEG